MLKDYYAVLRVGRTATVPEIKAAYRRLAAENHPDKAAQFGPSAETHAALVMRELNEAMAVLGDPVRRFRYDADRAASDLERAEASLARRVPETSPAARDTSHSTGISTSSVQMIGRVYTLPERFFRLPLRWVKVMSPNWTWCIAGTGIGRPVVIAYRHVDALDAAEVRLLDAAISRLNRHKGGRFASGPWPIVLVTTKRVRQRQATLRLLNVAASRGRGLFNKKPMIVVYDGEKDATIRLGYPPRHLFVGYILHFVLEP